MSTSVNLVPFFGVFISSVVQKAYSTIQSQINRSVKISKTQFHLTEEIEGDLSQESLQSKMGQIVGDSEKQGMGQQPPAGPTSGPIHQNKADENDPTSVLGDGENTNDVASDSSITTLCDDQGFKTIIAVNQNLGNPPSPRSRKTYLETEIDSYSAIDFTKKELINTQSSATQSKSSLKAFTFSTPNPVLRADCDASQSHNIYSEVDKSKIRPKVPSKPAGVKIKAKQLETMLHLSTLSLARRPQENTLDKANSLERVNSLPNLSSSPESHPGRDVSEASRLSLAPGQVSDVQYAEIINLSKTSKFTTVRQEEATEYCDILPESPPYVNNLYTNTSRISDEEESIYEDVTIPDENRSKTKQKGSKISGKKSSQTQHADYETKTSPISEINFSFGRYENTENIALPALKHPGIFEVPKIYQNTSELAENGVILEPPKQFSSFKPSSVHGRDKNRPQPLSMNTSPNSCYENIQIDATTDSKNYSPASSYAATSSQYSGNSIASTATSSFQGIQVCYFPPTPPAEFYNKSLSYVNSPAQEEHQPTKVQGDPVTPKKSSPTNRASRSKIPKPLKQKPSFEQIQIPEEHAPPLPLAAHSPLDDVVQKPENEMMTRPAQRPPSGKAMRWYEKLGCIQTGSLQVSEPYGLPGERKKSKERRRSQFFVDSDDPNLPQPHQDPQPPGNQTYVNFEDIDSHVPGGRSSIQI